MSEHILDGLIVLAALGCGLVAGFFFAFSACVMAALGRLPAAQGIAAMQSINIVVINPAFLGVFFGTAVACLVLTVVSLAGWSDPGAAWLLAGGLLYPVGTVGITVAFNVPLNKELAAAGPESVEGATLWTRYLGRWTAWNHVRCAASLAAAASFSIALAAAA